MARLEKNQERRKIREKAKQLASGVPSTPDSPGEGAGSRVTGTTQRKCANCGQIGHIKTNKK